MTDGRDDSKADSGGEGAPLREETLSPWKAKGKVKPDAKTDGMGDTRTKAGEVSRKRPVLITLDGRRVSERFVLDLPRSVVGRDMSADLILGDGEVSRRHCAVTWRNLGDARADAPECWLSDAGSTNGTYLNGDIVEEETRLADGDMIRVGRTVLGFFLKDERVLELDQLLINMALHDSLTQLYKREYFFAELHREFDRSRRHDRPLSVAVVDIDYFKAVNDEFGHLSGDEVLRQFADLIRLSLREGDICGRFGGEEFAIVFPETDEEGAWNAAERIRSAIEKHDFVINPQTKRKITTSVGVATMHDQFTDKMELIESADKALYEAKQQGRNKSVAFSTDKPHSGLSSTQSYGNDT